MFSNPTASGFGQKGIAAAKMRIVLNEKVSISQILLLFSPSTILREIKSQVKEMSMTAQFEVNVSGKIGGREVDGIGNRWRGERGAVPTPS